MAYKKVKSTGTGAHGGKSRYMTRAETKTGARAARRREDKRATAHDACECDLAGCEACFEILRRDDEETKEVK